MVKASNDATLCSPGTRHGDCAGYEGRTLRSCLRERDTADPSTLLPPGFPVKVGGIGELSCGFLRRKPHTCPLVSAAW
jgi:hypothetical protein